MHTHTRPSNHPGPGAFHLALTGPLSRLLAAENFPLIVH